MIKLIKLSHTQGDKHYNHMTARLIQKDDKLMIILYDKNNKVKQIVRDNSNNYYYDAIAADYKLETQAQKNKREAKQKEFEKEYNKEKIAAEKIDKLMEGGFGFCKKCQSYCYGDCEASGTYDNSAPAKNREYEYKSDY